MALIDSFVETPTTITVENLQDLKDALVDGTLEINTSGLQIAGTAYIIPNISSGAGVPGTTPSKVGDIYIDTSNSNAYIATGTSSSGDWEQVDGAGGGGAGDLDDLSDVTITSLGTDELLFTQDGNTFINQTLSEAGIAAASHTHATSDITSGTFADARIAESNITQHEAALTITESQISDLGTYIENVSEDSTPQLGGNLDVNGNEIVSTSNGDITLNPNGTGNIILGSFEFDADQAVGAGQDNYVLTYDNSSGLISLEAVPGGAGGTVDTSGTPVANDFARFTDADTIEGRSYAETRADLSLEVGTDVQAYDAFLDDIAALTDPGADRMLFWDDSAGDIVWLTASTGLSISGTNMTVRTASTSQTGIVELAIASEVNSGTATNRAVTPDALAGSYAGQKAAVLQVGSNGTDLATGDGQALIMIPSSVTGMNLIDVKAAVETAGTTGTTDIQIRNITQGADMLSTKLTIDSGETSSETAASAAVIDTSNDDVSEGDVIAIDIDAVSTTAPTGPLTVVLEFEKP